MRHQRTLSVATAVAALLPLAVARGADLGSQTVGVGHEVVQWHGRSVDATGQGVSSPLEQTCTTTTCDALRLRIAFPAGTFTNADDGVLVSIKWATDYDQWNLYVDGPDGRRVAGGSAVDSNGQSVLLRRPRNGTYTIRVVPFLTSFVPGDTVYDGRAELFHDRVAPQPTGTQLLPELETVAPSEFSISGVPPVPSNPTGWRWTAQDALPTSCYLDEQLQNGSTRCLRFSNDIRNIGAGPVVLRFRYDSNVVTACRMEQEVQRVRSTPIRRGAGPCKFHVQHAHFHYQHFARYQLFAVGADGHVGSRPATVSKKVGFCTIDVDDFGFGGPAPSPRTYTFPTCNIPNNIPASHPAVWEYMGISPGWGDIYTWDLPGQYLDVSNVPDGIYEVVSRANPDNALLVGGHDHETGITCISMHGAKVTVLQEFPSQSNVAPLPACTAR